MGVVGISIREEEVMPAMRPMQLPLTPPPTAMMHTGTFLDLALAISANSSAVP